MPAAAVAQNAGHAGDQRGDQDDKPENNVHDDYTSRAAVRPAAGTGLRARSPAPLRVDADGSPASRPGSSQNTPVSLSKARPGAHSLAPECRGRGAGVA